MRVYYHDGTVEEYPPADLVADELERFNSTGHLTSTRDGVLSIEYGMTDRTQCRYKHHVLIPLVSIRRIEQS